MSNTGTIKWFDRKKGFGFASPAEGGEDIFIHQRNFASSHILDEGDTIFFNIGEHNGRPTAVEITLPPDAPIREQRRRRGRTAKKALDSEAADLDKMEVEDKANKDPSAPKQEGEGEAAAPRAGGGRNSKPRRRPDTRTNRNDKGSKAEGERTGEASSRRAEKKNEVKQAVRDSAQGD